MSTSCIEVQTSSGIQTRTSSVAITDGKSTPIVTADMHRHRLVVRNTCVRVVRIVFGDRYFMLGANASRVMVAGSIFPFGDEVRAELVSDSPVMLTSPHEDQRHETEVVRFFTPEEIAERAKATLPSVDDPLLPTLASTLAKLFKDRAEALASVTRLQEAMNAMVESRLGRCVRAFHLRFGHPVATTPRVPADDQVRFRLRLIAEEFFELLAAAGVANADMEAAGCDAHQLVSDAITSAMITVDMPEFADALGDLEYIIEGTRAVFGIDGAPIMAAIHKANMSKDPAYVASKDEHHRRPDPTQKPTKPATWKAPDIAGELEKQGWRRQ